MQIYLTVIFYEIFYLYMIWFRKNYVQFLWILKVEKVQMRI